MASSAFHVGNNASSSEFQQQRSQIESELHDLQQPQYQHNSDGGNVRAPLPTVNESYLTKHEEQMAKLKKALNNYIYDFLRKSELDNTASAFAEECDISENEYLSNLGNNNDGDLLAESIVNTPQGFLYEWWQIFWDLFNATTRRCGTESVCQYHDIIIQQQKKDMHFRNMASHAAKLQHIAEQKGTFRGENLDPMVFAILASGGLSDSSPAVMTDFQVATMSNEAALPNGSSNGTSVDMFLNPSSNSILPFNVPFIPPHHPVYNANMPTAGPSGILNAPTSFAGGKPVYSTYPMQNLSRPDNSMYDNSDGNVDANNGGMDSATSSNMFNSNTIQKTIPKARSGTNLKTTHLKRATKSSKHHDGQSPVHAVNTIIEGEVRNNAEQYSNHNNMSPHSRTIFDNDLTARNGSKSKGSASSLSLDKEMMEEVKHSSPAADAAIITNRPSSYSFNNVNIPSFSNKPIASSPLYIVNDFHDVTTTNSSPRSTDNLPRKALNKGAKKKKRQSITTTSFSVAPTSTSTTDSLKSSQPRNKSYGNFSSIKFASNRTKNNLRTKSKSNTKHSSQVRNAPQNSNTDNKGSITSRSMFSLHDTQGSPLHDTRPLSHDTYNPVDYHFNNNAAEDLLVMNSVLPERNFLNSIDPHQNTDNNDGKVNPSNEGLSIIDRKDTTDATVTNSEHEKPTTSEDKTGTRDTADNNNNQMSIDNVDIHDYDLDILGSAAGDFNLENWR
ncbi:hypothetical protein KAFR_0K01910 [Kazachstania africana CBS 2517]|uniref:Uncharacterized protein n=1 Tax=Kazachstania africana (strain ATCC 22294 / BCRC 22015 / CBS 2517 / CECT 1963 / NBRC 1671 / NRRL Y-8276) TaxID=1071382 RepID=H2B1P5_KAZAF|nr:hypothetical protein KAFR_0K01910 [Kazachstania africana CBS 2517]CCF60545.1 hypothetical protein KAFR_0K01910 [Kazachstania africana CBS 2517]